jgi:hypothetical protein
MIEAVAPFASRENREDLAVLHLTPDHVSDRLSA